MAVILVAAAGAAVWFGRDHASAPVARYRFAAQHYPGGLAIRQLWALSGPGGSLLDVSMTVSNASSKAVTAQLAEPIPAGVARDRGSVAFSGAVTPLATSPLVVWDLHLPARGHDVVSYQVDEPASGVSEHRLMAYVHAYVGVSPQQELELIAHPGLFSRVWISPHELRLNVGHAGRLTANGRLYNGHLAPRADLTGAVWTTENPAVLSVNRSGRVFAVSPGKVLVWVQIGGTRARATVIVRGRGGEVPPTANQGQPPVQSSTSPSPSSSGSPSPSPSGSGSPSPTSPPPTSGSPTPPASPPAAQTAAGRARLAASSN